MDISITVKNTEKGTKFNIKQVEIPEKCFDAAFEEIGRCIKEKLEELSLGEIISKIKKVEYGFRAANINNTYKIVLGRKAFEKVKDSCYEACSVITTKDFDGGYSLMGYPVKVDIAEKNWYVGLQVGC